MKKIYSIIFCLICSAATPVTASDSFATKTLNVLYCIGRGIRYFYFPDYDPLVAPQRKVKESYWSEQAIEQWDLQSFKEGEAPHENTKENLDYQSTPEDEELYSAADYHEASK